ncbi:Hypothetical protein NTJ_15743 [Nesidiocoris tenuis]|uniref:Tyr recombinase domain-containing protein n=1 Tax=Nesidiocoris tenuis TaxID=355587 RepID=A0ABN7BEX2_9HEMI|nr:Hypothetical protein NTJ_15743 [Nesidiocoris tenuis]
MLLALTSGQRVQTLASIDTKGISVVNGAIRIAVNKTVKTSGRGRPQPVICLPIYSEDCAICPVTALNQYLKMTRPLRGDITSLFVTTKPPFKAAFSQTISRWLKEVLKLSGVSCKFSAHSTRHSSTSAAHRNGVSYDLIRKAAGWSEKSSTFARFYQRPLVARGKETDFAQAVLSCA